MSTGTSHQPHETAADLMRCLQTEHTTTGRGRRGDIMGAGHGPRPVTPSTPLDMGVLDYIERASNEIEAWTRAAVPSAGVAPDGAAAYEWMAEATRDLDGRQADARDAIIRRHELQHAIRMGDHAAARRYPCPRCGCLGVVWSPRIGMAVCTWSRCTAGDGEPSVWTLRQLTLLPAEVVLLRRAT